MTDANPEQASQYLGKAQRRLKDTFAYQVLRGLVTVMMFALVGFAINAYASAITPIAYATQLLFNAKLGVK